MPIRFYCRGCQARIKVPDQAAGRKIKCPRCGLLQVAPEAQEPHDTPPQEQVEPAPAEQPAAPPAADDPLAALAAAAGSESPPPQEAPPEEPARREEIQESPPTQAREPAPEPEPEREPEPEPPTEQVTEQEPVDPLAALVAMTGQAPAEETESAAEQAPESPTEPEPEPTVSPVPAPPPRGKVASMPRPQPSPPISGRPAAAASPSPSSAVGSGGPRAIPLSAHPSAYRPTAKPIVETSAPVSTAAAGKTRSYPILLVMSWVMRVLGVLAIGGGVRMMLALRELAKQHENIEISLKDQLVVLSVGIILAIACLTLAEVMHLLRNLARRTP